MLHWLAARRVQGLWIMPDEAIYGIRALGLWHGSLGLHGGGAGYSTLYPLLAGGPLSIGSLSTGYALLKPVQAVVMSLAAWPVYAYGRRLMPARYALLAAALTVASPIVLFSGFVMTEVLYYPLAAASLLAVAQAVERPTRKRQAVALVLIALSIATRVQAVAFFAIFAAAILLDALLARSRSRLRAFWPVWALVGAAIVAALALPGTFGAYSSTLTGGYRLGAAARLVYDNLAYAFVMVGVAPVAALVLLLVQGRRERRPDERAVLAVTTCTVVVVVLQVGVFASRYAPHPLGRDLAALPPLLFLVLSLWLARGAQRPRVVTPIVLLCVLAVVVLAPWGDLVSANAFTDATSEALALRHLFGLNAAATFAVAAAIALALIRLAPRALLPLFLGVLLIATSVYASNLATALAARYQTILVGEPRDWIDRAVAGPVTYVYGGDTEIWTVVWEQRFWNRRLDRVVSLAPNFVPGPVVQKQVQVPRDGRLPIAGNYAVTNSRLTLEGTPIAQQSRGPDEYALTLWRLARPARVSTRTEGVLPNGDMVGPAHVTAYACGGGSLELTLLPKATDALEVDLDGKPVLRTKIGGRDSWNGSIPVPRGHSSPCVFTIRGGLLLGSTRIAFVG